MSEGNISNIQLINNYYTSAGKQLTNTIKDWSNHELWRNTVRNLNDKHRVVYLIIVLDQQVMNGGFIQYFDNSYGMFAYQTLEALKTIGANNSAKLLSQAIHVVNHNSLSEHNFEVYISNNIVEDKLGDKLDKLDNQYYELESTEDLELLLSNWIRAN